MKYKAFISYSHTDKKWARWLHRALESYRPPQNLRAPDGTPLSGRLSPIFRDRDELPSTANLTDAVNKALAQSEYLIVICSPRAAASRWVNEEIRNFRSLRDASKILCFIIDGEPATGNERECFPDALTAPEANTTALLEPVAADARTEGDGRSNAMLKIAAGMLGVGFDALRQRETRRRHRRLVVVATSSFLIAALTIVLAINAVIARDEAQRRRAEAEDLIDFMLGDLRGQLRKIGRLDVFESVGDKALAYFASQKDSDDTQRTLAQRAKNLRQIGNDRLARGEKTAALEAFTESLLISERLAASDPNDSEAQLKLANSRFYVGYVHWQRGEFGLASAIFEGNIDIVDAISAKEPDNTEWLVERAYTYTNLGRVLELQGAYEEALTAYRVVMTVNQRLTELEPGNNEWELELGFANNNLGKLLFTLGRLDEADFHFRRDLEIKQQIYAAEPAHNTRRSYLAVSQYYLGQLLAARGEYDESETILDAAQRNFQYLNTVDPERQKWRLRRANIEHELGKVYEYTDRTTESMMLLQSSIELLNELLHSDQPIMAWRRDMVGNRLTHADFSSRQGDLDTANQQLALVKVQMDMLLGQEQVTLDIHELSVYLDLCLSRLESSPSDDSHLQAALQTLNEFFVDSPDPRIKELRAAVLAGLGEYEAARELRNELMETGFLGRRLELIEK